MHLSPIQRYRPGRIAAANPAAGQHTRAGLNRRPWISTYQYIPVHTVSYLLVLFLVPPCTSLYLLVPPRTEKYIPVHTSMYCHRNVMCQYVPVCTGMYNFDISRTASYPEEDVLVCTSTYHLVLPRTRGTGFQMSKKRSKSHRDSDTLVSQVQLEVSTSSSSLSSCHHDHRMIYSESSYHDSNPAAVTVAETVDQS